MTGCQWLYPVHFIHPSNREKCMCPSCKAVVSWKVLGGGIVSLVKKYISKFVQEVNISRVNVVVVKLVDYVGAIGMWCL